MRNYQKTYQSLQNIEFTRRKMGQQQLSQLKSKVSEPNTCHQQATQSLAFLDQILRHAEQITGQPLAPSQIQQHIVAYLSNQSQAPDLTAKRRRSYQLLQTEDKVIEELGEKQEQLTPGCKVLQQQMKWLEDIEEEVRTNITEIMTTQKSFKIRQYFRKIILEILKLDNLFIYVLTANGKLELHDFANNFITELRDEQKLITIERIILEGYQQEKTLQVMKEFDVVESQSEESSLYQWNVHKDPKLSILYLTKKLQYESPCRFSQKIISKITSIAMISTSEEEISIIQNYSKDFLEVLELLVKECEVETCQKMGSSKVSMHEVEQEASSRQEKDEMLLTRVEAFQQLQFELLQRIRMYKKYVCEGDKIFMEFDESAELAFLSNNFSHPLFKRLPQLWERKKMFIEKIFEDYKPINEFVKKAVQQKVKPNKLYEINFQSKVRVKYDREGRITKMHVIFEELDNSSSSSSNIYTSSSTKILSEGSMKGSFNDLEANEKEHRQSALVRNLEKDNPGIINQGWINLFIKDQHLNSRNNSYFKNRAGKGYTVKRSISLNRSFECVPETTETKDSLQHINIESIDLNLLELQEELLEPLVLKVFRRLQFFHGENINQNYFLNFLSDIHNGYQMHNNPFHNFTHGVNVMHTCYLLANSTKNKQPLSPFKLFTIVFSGLCHDVGHTGFTNLFEIASGSKKAITYNDSSPLENFHAAYTFELLKKPENNFLKDLSTEEVKEFRKSVISNILYTDIKEHFPLLKKFNALIKDQIPVNDQYMSILSGMIVHTADFGGSAKEFQVCKAWSLKVNLEFSNQYKREGELGLPQTPFMKDLSNIHTLSKNEGGFLKVIVFPLYQAMDQYCGNDPRVRKLRQYAESNIKRWQQIHSESQPQQKTAA